MTKRIEFLEQINPSAVVYFPHGRLLMGQADAAVDWLKLHNIPIFTPLTILQAESIGLKVEHALPFTQEDPKDFEDPKALITESNFEKNDATMQAPESKIVGSMEINNDYIQLTTKDDPKQVVAQLSLDDLKEALQ